MFVAETKPAAPSPAAGRKAPRICWKAIAAPVRPFLDEVAAQLSMQVGAFEPEIAAYAQYALTNQGKHLRPSLVALSGAAAGRMDGDLVKVAVIIEMVHLATLVHDDVMDAAQIRRRRPTMAAHWGNEISILMGDCLFAHALKLAASFPTPDICRAVAAATNTVCSGEILQTQQRGNFHLSREKYFKMLAMKTAELFALSCDLGAGWAKTNEPRRTALRNYGMALGTAYQLYDDCLDLFGSEEEVGKSLGTDLANGKLTLPILVAWERADKAQQSRLRQLVLPWHKDSLASVLDILEQFDALNECRRIIHQYLSSARQQLNALPASPSRDALAAFADFLAQQTGDLGFSS